MTDSARQVEIVNQEDEVVEKRDLKQVLEAGLPHRFVHIYVMDDDNRILILKQRPQTQDSDGHWSASITGVVFDGESYTDAAVREARGGMGMAPDVTRVGKFAAIDRDGSKDRLIGWGCLFLTRGEKPPRGWRKEAEEFKWVSFDGLTQMMQKVSDHLSPSLTASFQFFKRALAEVE